VKGNAILQVTNALHERLKLALAASGVPGTVFVGPLDDPDASGAALILFLYRVVPNSNLRNSEHIMPSANPPPLTIVFKNSLPLDLYYLVTVGNMPGSSEETLLGALGFAMQALQNDPHLTGQRLDYETVHVSLEPTSTEEISRIWTLFPAANYRTSVAYLVTPVWIDPLLPPSAAVPVTQDSLLTGPKVAEFQT
jgi:hypothetical protein